MLDVFFEEVYPTLDTENTGVLVVANVNPYGMKYMRRYNENNVDLNRNFIEDWENFDRSSNKEYPKVDKFLQPEGKMGNAFWHEVGFYLSLAKEAIFTGADTISDALLTGQYEYPEGVYYGGDGDEISLFWIEPNDRKARASFFAVFRRFSWQFEGYGQNGFFGQIAIY